MDDRLRFGECVVVAVPLLVTDGELHDAIGVLNDEELARADRFVTTELRRRFAVCRGRLRILLGHWLNMAAERIEFEYSRLGKPRLKGGDGLHFNVSHSQDWGLMAFSITGPVGVDIEFLDRRLNHDAIASELLTPDEHTQWTQLPDSDRRRELLNSWVAKEAVLKALGLGITRSLHKIELPVPQPASAFAPRLAADLLDEFPELSITSPRKLQPMEVVPDSVAAVYGLGHIEHYTCCAWSEASIRRR